LVALAQRADQLVVLHLMGTHPAGRYSVALTAGQLPLYVPLAIALAGFARLAYLSESDSMIVLGGMCRIGTAGALISTLVAAPLLPIAIPVFFGSAFSQAVVPALILLPGGVLWSLQWILGRAATARSQPSLLVQSFGLTLATMVILDYVLVPRLGLAGAAIASDIASLAGLCLCVAVYRLRRPEFRIGALVPRLRDFATVVGVLRQVLRRGSLPGAAAGGQD
jgi:O-antigen/teichoic acid export membrane protein